MIRKHALGAMVLLLVGAAVVFAQEQQRLGNILITRSFTLGAGVPFRMEGTTADAFEFTIWVDPTADTDWVLPATNGAAGTQLQTDGIAGTSNLSWASAGSSRDIKDLNGFLDPQDALKAVLSAPVHTFHYKPHMGTLDSQTQYAGIIADEAPWAMHFNGTILNPVNGLGYTTAAIQAQQAQIDALKAEIAALKAGR